MPSHIHESAEVADTAHVGDATYVWHFAQIREKATVGSHCVIGRGVYVGTGVPVGDNCKIQNYALIYEPATIGNGVFIGPGVILTNDTYPRAVTPDGATKNADDWNPTGVIIEDGASIGAHATCVAPVTIGAWAVVAAGAVVARDVLPHALVAGVPARQIGWVGFSGTRLIEQDGMYVCPELGDRFQKINGMLRKVSE